MDKDRKEGIVVKICCVLLAFALWLYITSTQNPMVTYTIKRIPVQIKSSEVLLKNKLILQKQSGYYIDIKVQSKSSEQKAKASDFKAIIDLSGYVVKKGENKLPIQIERSPSNVSILNNGDLWLNLSIDEVIEKIVPVKINLVGKSQSGSFVKDVISNPNKIKILGPSEKVNLVDRVVGTFSVNKNTEMKESVINVIPVDASGNEVKGVNMDADSVHVSLGVNMTKEVPIKVVTKGSVSDNLKLSKLEPSISIIKIIGDEKVIKNINYIETSALDLSSISASTSKEVNLVLPTGVEILNNIKVINVNIIMDEKSTERTLSSKINIENLAPNFNAQLGKELISYKVTGSENIINGLNENDFKVYVDLSGAKEGNNMVNINIVTPQGVSLVSKDFTQMNVKLMKKESEVVNDNTSK
ncbi:CdaR family protein [Hathewaya limosa]|uniref:YbbR domain-containing protein n=1 Tax=Hathewaya limosa TaxID=1536 RepID=A0ABU0JVG2_HATLI|nr:CdaR family protein [Hathewaya limosa]MDQ0480039.1 YbbR domain-containing protein [Hathewaya limosa]